MFSTLLLTRSAHMCAQYIEGKKILKSRMIFLSAYDFTNLSLEIISVLNLKVLENFVRQHVDIKSRRRLHEIFYPKVQCKTHFVGNWSIMWNLICSSWFYMCAAPVLINTLLGEIWGYRVIKLEIHFLKSEINIFVLYCK